MNNKKIAEFCEKISFFIELDNPFSKESKIYKNLSKIFKYSDESFSEIIQSSNNLPLSVISSINEIITKKHSKKLFNLTKKYPETLFFLNQVPGLFPKKIKYLFKNYKISSIETLMEALEEGRIENSKEFSPSLINKLKNGIKYITSLQGFKLIDKTIEIAFNLYDLLAPYTKNIAISGSLRRRCELNNKIELVIIPNNIIEIKKFIEKNFECKIKSVNGKKTMTFKTDNIEVVFHLADEVNFPIILFYSTGNKEHVNKIEDLYKKKGFELNTTGVLKDGKLCKINNEEDIYKLIEIQYIPPELREGEFEISLAKHNKIPDLISDNDVRGVFHIHSNFSDGVHSLEEIANKAIELGFEYIGISDHSKNADYAGGLKEDSIIRQKNEIYRLNNKFNNKFKIFFGIESDILKNGELDYSCEILNLFDFVIASIHSYFNMSEEEMTDRIIKAVNNPYTTFLGHPTGRLLTKREGYKVNIPKIIFECAKTGTGIEINCNPYRLDIDWRFLQIIKNKNIPVFICPDAHHKNALNYYTHGVGIARKGGLTKNNIVNSKSLSEISNYLKGFRK